MSVIEKKAVILTSGGLDSATVLAIAKNQNYSLYALSFDYHQSHDIELECAKRLASYFEVKKHVIFPLDLSVFGGSALTDSKIPVPQGRDESEMSSGIPITYVPARNTIFLSVGLAFAETLDATDIFLGVNALDYSGYPDCRPEYVKSFEKMANLATKSGVEGHSIKIHSPLIHLKKSQIIQKGVELGVDYSMTHSCYNPDVNGDSCGQCDSCQLRLKGFLEAGIDDPVVYQVSKTNL